MAGQQDYLEHAFLQGKIIPFKDANISVATNGLQYGIGIFGGIKGYKQDNGQIGIFRLDEHIERLQRSAKILRFQYDFDAKKIKDIFIELTKKNAPKGNVYYRPFIYRSDIALSPAIKGNYDMTLYMLNIADYFDKSRGLKVCVSSWTRNNDNALPPRTKASGGYVNAALAMHDAVTSGFDAAVMLDDSGHVGEGAVMNIYMVRDGVIYTPNVTADILEGITRRTITELAEKLHIPIVERVIDRTELYIADEIFFSGTATELTWVQSIDNVDIRDKAGPVYTKLQEAFDQAVHDKDSPYLTLV
ncbi:branched-chain amino acid transaminase [Candidatus Saccharibacteria bacterium]|nr:MAG: branched-chain amino acid transaminase [Candidatus Saccharibacteria bacterium]